MSTSASKRGLRKNRIAVLGGYEIITVNAAGVRDLAKRDEEFTNFAIHRDFPDLIGRSEIWIDTRFFENEGFFYLGNAPTRLRAQERGIAEKSAYAAGLNVRDHLRERLVGARYRAGKAHERVPPRIYDRDYATLADVKRPVEVWLVLGNLVRSYYKTDYCEGGHGYVYPWIAKGEIWVEHDLEPAEVPYIVAHEYLELRLMRDRRLDTTVPIPSAPQWNMNYARGVRPEHLSEPTIKNSWRDDLPKLTSQSFFEDVVGKYVARD